MNNKICIIGANSNISKSFMSMIDKTFDIITVGKSPNNDIQININNGNFNSINKIPLNCSYYLIAAGTLYPKRIIEQTNNEILNSVSLNLLFPTYLIEQILDINKDVKIVVIGSESGKKGSYDTTYFLSKAALKSYIEEKHIKFKNQSLNMISPSVILDTKMTQERDDLEEVLERAKDLPKERYLMSEEVAKLIHYLFFEDSGYINNEVINMNGGKFARMNYK